MRRRRRSIHLPSSGDMLFLDGVYVERLDGSVRFGWAKVPTSAKLNGLAHTLAQRVGRFLERRGLPERDAEQS